MLSRIFLTWGVVGRVFGEWISPFLTLILFFNLRLLIAFGMALDHLFFPEVRSKNVKAPIVIVANPRSGTTFMHRWLSEKGFGQGVQLYRSLYPSLTIQKLLQPLLPTLEKFNPARYHSAAAHETSLTSVETDDVGVFFRFFDGMFLFSFLLAFDTEDHQDLANPKKRDTSKRDFDWMEKVWARNLVATNTERQCAKVFTLAGRLPQFLERFPDAKIIYMVRDPISVMPSTMKLVSVPLHARFGFWDLPEEVKKRYTGRLYDGMVELYRSFHEDWTTGKIDRSKVFIMRYDRMMQDFDGMMEELLPWLGADADQELMAEIQQIAEKQRARKSKHKYSLEEFYLDGDKIRTDLAFIYDTFLSGDPREAKGLWGPND